MQHFPLHAEKIHNGLQKWIIIRGAWPWGIRIGPFAVLKTYFCKMNCQFINTPHADSLFLHALWPGPGWQHGVILLKRDAVILSDGILEWDDGVAAGLCGRLGENGSAKMKLLFSRKRALTLLLREHTNYGNAPITGKHELLSLRERTSCPTKKWFFPRINRFSAKG